MLQDRPAGRLEVSVAVEERGHPSSASAFGALLRDYRLAAGLTQEALAELARMSATGIGALERGKRHTPHRDTLTLLADALQLSSNQRAAFHAAARAHGWRVRKNRSAEEADLAPESRNTNVPSSLSSFVGRAQEIADISGLVAEHRLVTLTGAGGVGKTRCALEIGTRLLDQFPNGVWFVDLAPLRDPSLVVTTVARALGVQDAWNRAPIDALTAYIKRKALLLIFDNCEHVIQQAAVMVDDLLKSCAGVRALATSREPLRIEGERLYRLPSLNVPSPGALRGLRTIDVDRYSALALFVERARGADYRFALTDEAAATIGEICRRLDGIPLAIELAAARLTILPVRTLFQRLERRFSLLTAGKRTSLPRQQTMRAVIDWSYELLSTDERQLFETLSIFAGGCTFEAAAAVFGGRSGENDDASRNRFFELLSSLIDKSLVQADLEAEPRYRLLESFREYAHERLVARGEWESVARSHAVVYTELAEQINGSNWTHGISAFASDNENELDNWRAALQWTIGSRNDIALGQRLIISLNLLWFLKPTESYRWVCKGLELVATSTPELLVGRLEYVAGYLAQRLYDEENALRHAERALASFRKVGDAVGQVQALTLFGLELTHAARVAEAEAPLREALERARALGRSRLLGWALRWLGFARSAVDLNEARTLLTEACAVYAAAGDGVDASAAATNLAEVEYLAGRAATAAVIATDTVKSLRSQTGVVAAHLSVAIANLAEYLVALDRFDEALPLAEEALHLAREEGNSFTTLGNAEHLAAITILERGSDVSMVRAAARVVGFVDKRLRLRSSESPRGRTEQLQYDRIMATLRERFDPHDLAELLTTGAMTSEDDAVEEALLLAQYRNRVLARSARDASQPWPKTG